MEECREDVPSHIILDWAFWNWEGNSYSGDIDIPSTVIIPELGTEPFAVTMIGEGAFKSCINLHSISLPSSIRKIGAGAFYHCTALTSLHLNDEIQYVGMHAFEGCRSMHELHFPLGCTKIDYSTMTGCGIDDGDLHLTGVDNVTYVAHWGLSSCGLKEFPYMPSLKKVEDTSFRSTLLEALDLSYIFNGAGLFKDGCWHESSSLKSIILPALCPDNFHKAFEGCPSISYIKIFNREPPELEEDWSARVAPGCVLDVPDMMMDKYLSHPYWSKFAVKAHSSSGSVECQFTENIQVVINDGILSIDAPSQVIVIRADGTILGQGSSLRLQLPVGLYIIKGESWERKVFIP